MNSKPIFFLIMSIGYLGLLLSGCGSGKTADLVLTNGTFYTVDAQRSVAQTLAVKDGKIIFVGDDKGVADRIGENTKVIDLDGKLVLPGFIDSHAHSISSYRYFFEIQLNGLATYPQIQERITEYINRNPEVVVVRGRGWNNTDFPGSGPDKRELDKLIPDRPARFQSEDGHSIWVNSETLRRAGITAATADPAGGIIERYAGSNEPSGVLRENATDLVSDVFPGYSAEQLMQGLMRYQRMVLGFGITTVHDPYLDAGSNEMTAFETLEAQDSLLMRFRSSLYVDPEQGPEQVLKLAQERARHSGPLFRSGSAKLFADGVVEGATAYLSEAYRHQPESRGKFLWRAGNLDSVCAELERYGFQIHIHAIGDAGVSASLDALQYARTVNQSTDRRHQITHLQLVTSADIDRFGKLEVIAVTQPFWFMKDAYYHNIQVPYLGQPRADHEYPMASFFNAGVLVTASSDFPVTYPPNPLVAIETGITRSLPGISDPLWQEEAATLEQMITAYTVNGAKANLLENETGSLEVGKSADFIILDRNLFSIPATEIRDARVLRTFFRGKEVYSATN